MSNSTFTLKNHETYNKNLKTVIMTVKNLKNPPLRSVAA